MNSLWLITSKDHLDLMPVLESNPRDGMHPCNCVMKVCSDGEFYVADYKQRSFRPHACGSTVATDVCG